MSGDGCPTLRRAGQLLRFHALQFLTQDLTTSLFRVPPRVLVNALQEAPEVVHLYLRGNTMTQVGNPTTSALQEALAHLLDFRLNGLLSSVQQHRVGISLQSDLVTNELSCLTSGDTAVETENVVAGFRSENIEGRVGALGEQGHGYAGVAERLEFGSDLLGDVLTRWKSHFLVEDWRQFTRPGVEYLKQLQTKCVKRISKLM